MSRHYYRDHTHTSPGRLRPAPGASTFAAVVGTVDTSSEQAITGRNGHHLKFNLNVSTSVTYQVDINTQSRDGTDVLVYVADETLQPAASDPPFGPPAFGVTLAPEAQLSYAGLGLADSEFVDTADGRLDSQLEAALGQAQFVSVYGMTYDDGGRSGKGIHETHMNPGRENQDGAIAVYLMSDASPIRRWFYFRFQGDSIG